MRLRNWRGLKVTISFSFQWGRIMHQWHGQRWGRTNIPTGHQWLLLSYLWFLTAGSDSSAPGTNSSSVSIPSPLNPPPTLPLPCFCFLNTFTIGNCNLLFLNHGEKGRKSASRKVLCKAGWRKHISNKKCGTDGPSLLSAEVIITHNVHKAWSNQEKKSLCFPCVFC